MNVIADLCVVPMGVGVSVSRYGATFPVDGGIMAG